MVVLLIVLVFAAFVALDLWTQHSRNTRLAREGETLHHALEKTEPLWAGGFKLFPSLSYHHAHVWIHQVSPDQAYIGLDDFARRLVGRTAKITPPKVGSHFTQGEGAIKVKRNGDEAWLVSPVGGEVVAVNPMLRNDPSLPFHDNYGRGWICKIRSPLLFKEAPNLLRGSLVQRWLEDTRDNFQHQLMLATGSVIQDGGTSIEDIASGLGSEEWRTLVSEFLTSKSAGPQGR